MSSREITLVPLTYTPEDWERWDALLDRYATQVGVSLSSQQRRLCLEHLLYVQQVNQTINLTRIDSVHDGLLLHLADSLSLVPYIPQSVSRVLDIGTGAGFPGLPIHVATGLPAVLMDSVGKKVAVVDKIDQALELDHVTCVHARAEQYATSHKYSTDLVVARAVSSLPVLLEYATPLLRDNGYVLLAKGTPESEEIKKGDQVAQICGLKRLCLKSFELPEEAGHRTVLLYQKTRPASIKLPRAVGLARKNPLA